MFQNKAKTSGVYPASRVSPLPFLLNTLSFSEVSKCEGVFPSLWVFVKYTQWNVRVARSSFARPWSTLGSGGVQDLSVECHGTTQKTWINLHKCCSGSMPEEATQVLKKNKIKTIKDKKKKGLLLFSGNAVVFWSGGVRGGSACVTSAVPEAKESRIVPLQSWGCLFRNIYSPGCASASGTSLWVVLMDSC